MTNFVDLLWIFFLHKLLTQKGLLTLCILILITSFANIFIKLSLSSIKLQIMSNQKQLKVGRYIGTVERILTVPFWLAFFILIHIFLKFGNYNLNLYFEVYFSC
jgi:hypothetical protein